jgi:hypothetical protein
MAEYGTAQAEEQAAGDAEKARNQRTLKTLPSSKISQVL